MNEKLNNRSEQYYENFKKLNDSGEDMGSMDFFAAGYNFRISEEKKEMDLSSEAQLAALVEDALAGRAFPEEWNPRARQALAARTRGEGK